jgi:hypothetical protein
MMIHGASSPATGSPSIPSKPRRRNLRGGGYDKIESATARPLFRRPLSKADQRLPARLRHTRSTVRAVRDVWLGAHLGLLVRASCVSEADVIARAHQAAAAGAVKAAHPRERATRFLFRHCPSAGTLFEAFLMNGCFSATMLKNIFRRGRHSGRPMEGKISHSQ